MGTRFLCREGLRTIRCVRVSRYTFVNESVTRPGRYTFARRMCIDGILLPGKGIPRRRDPGEIALPARKRRRSGDFIRNPDREGPSGVEMAPELGFRPHLLLECALRRENGAGAAIIAGFSLRSGFRRQNLAGRRVTDGIPFEKRLPASKWRRRGGFVRRRCKALPSGATSTNT